MSTDSSAKKSIIVTLSVLTALLVAFTFVLPEPAAPQLMTTFVPSQMYFEFVFQPGSDLTIVSTVLQQCELPDCQDAMTADPPPVWELSCTEDHCTSMASSYLQYFRLRVAFSDGVSRESNVFTKENFNASYRVQVRDADLLVDEKPKPTREPTRTPDLPEEEEKVPEHDGPSLGGMFASLGLVTLFFGCLSGIPFIGLLIILGMLVERAGRDKMNFSDSRILILISWFLSLILLAEGAILISVLVVVVIEVILVILYAVIRQKDKIVLATSALIGNTFTALAFWFVFFAMERGYPVYAITMAAIFTWLVEALIYFLLNRRKMPIGEVLVLSLVLNGFTFLIGLVLP